MGIATGPTFLLLLKFEQSCVRLCVYPLCIVVNSDAV